MVSEEDVLTTDIEIRREGRRILVVVPIERNSFRFYLSDREAAEIVKRLRALIIPQPGSRA